MMLLTVEINDQCFFSISYFTTILEIPVFGWSCIHISRGILPVSKITFCLFVFFPMSQIIKFSLHDIPVGISWGSHQIWSLSGCPFHPLLRKLWSSPGNQYVRRPSILHQWFSHNLSGTDLWELWSVFPFWYHQDPIQM